MIAADLGVVGLLPPAGLLVLRAGLARESQGDVVAYGLHFPAGLEEQAVIRFLAFLGGILPPWWRRLAYQPVVSFEVLADATGVRHRLLIPRKQLPQLEVALQAHLPSVRYVPVPATAATPRLGVEYRASTEQRPLRVDTVAMTSGLLASLQPLRPGEQVVLQWLLTPAGPVRPPRLASTRDRTPLLPDAELLATAEAVAARKQKLRAPLLLAVGRIGADAETTARAIGLLRQVEAPLHGSRAPGAHLRRRLMPKSLVARRVARRAVPLTRYPALLNVEEAVGLIGWPVGLRTAVGLALGGCRLLPVSTATPRRGTVLGSATFPGQAARPVALNLESRFRPLAITGPTGVGKSTLLARIVGQDIAAGRGVVVLDPKGDVVRLVAERIPERRLGDVIVLDAGSDQLRLPGYNPLHSHASNRDLVVEQMLGIMHAIWRANWGPRTDELLRAALATLTASGHYTLCELPAVLTDSAFRRRLLSGVHDPFGVEGIWASFEAWSEAERLGAVAPVLNKVRALTTRPNLRAVLGQPTGAVDFSRIIAKRQILLVNLAAGTIGSDAAYLLGALLFGGLWDAVTARGRQPHERRVPIMAVIDEFQHIVALPTPAETILAEARSYKLGLALAHQHLGQLTEELRQAVLANARNKLVFQTSRVDAGTFAKELGGDLTAEDLMGLGAYEAVVRLVAEGRVQPPATILTEPLGPALRPAEAVFQRSAEQWGVERSAVDAALEERLQTPRTTRSTGVGRSPRSRA